MKKGEDFHTKLFRALGTIMVIAWIFVLGPVGGLLLGGTTYAMLASSPGVGACCGALLFFPFVLTLVWGVMKFLELHRERIEKRASLLTETERITSPVR